MIIVNLIVVIFILSITPRSMKVLPSGSINRVIRFINIPAIQNMLINKNGLSYIEDNEIALISDEDF